MREHLGFYLGQNPFRSRELDQSADETSRLLNDLVFQLADFRLGSKPDIRQCRDDNVGIMSALPR